MCTASSGTLTSGRSNWGHHQRQSSASAWFSGCAHLGIRMAVSGLPALPTHAYSSGPTCVFRSFSAMCEDLVIVKMIVSFINYGTVARAGKTPVCSRTHMFSCAAWNSGHPGEVMSRVEIKITGNTRVSPRYSAWETKTCLATSLCFCASIWSWYSGPVRPYCLMPIHPGSGLPRCHCTWQPVRQQDLPPS